MSIDTQTVARAQPETVALFVSDLHLQASMPRTAQAFFRFLDRHARGAQRLYLLGDLFEAWAGDDDIDDPFHRRVVDALRVLSDDGVDVFWICGNRDFLVGQRFAAEAGLTLLPDPYVATLAGQRIVLSHGDAACTDDLAYIAFRNQVREHSWQEHFLAQPLALRKKIIEGVRMGSRQAQVGKSAEIMDVNAVAIDALFDSSQSALMIHGHTHRPALHDHDGRLRYVLTDWDCDTDPPRAGWLSLEADGSLQRHDQSEGARLAGALDIA
jgi:UDP-2,3-diacylglucosamine hydrolase